MPPDEESDATDEDLREAFNTFDKDGDGVISVAELSTVMSDLGETTTNTEIMEMMNEADEDGDGQINYQEFVKVIPLTEPMSNGGLSVGSERRCIL